MKLITFALLGTLWAALLVVGVSARAAEQAPPLKFELIDDDGQVTQLDWKSSTAWTWNDKSLVLQIWFEVPQHLTTSLPVALRSRIQTQRSRAPFAVSPEHVLFSLPIDKSVELLPFDRDRERILRISVDYQKTNWMRHSNCREKNPYLELKGMKDPGPLFVSLFCSPAENGTWIEIAAARDVRVDIDLARASRAKKHDDEIFAVYLPDTASGSVVKLANLSLVGDEGEVLASYHLDAQPPLPDAKTLDETTGADDAHNASRAVTRTRTDVGLHAQWMDAYREVSGNRDDGRSRTEFALSLNMKKRLHAESEDALAFELELPIRRLGTGLDGRSAGNHMAWTYLGYRPHQTVDLSYGLQASILDVRLRPRESVVSVAPAIQLTGNFFGQHAFTFAPIDVRSNLSVMRLRSEFPVGIGASAVVEGVVGRTIVKGSDDYTVNGATLGFAGAF